MFLYNTLIKNQRIYIIKKFYLLQQLDTNLYFGKYRCDEYLTSDIEEAYQFSEPDNLELDEYAIDFLKETDSYFKIVEILKF